MQLHEISIIFDGNGKIDAVDLSGYLYKTDSKINQFGLIDCVLDDRLLCIIAFLAFKKLTRYNQEWISAQELAISIGHQTTSAIQKFLERRIKNPLLDSRLRENAESIASRYGVNKLYNSDNLIDCKPIFINGKLSTGTSKGPYRLGGQKCRVVNTNTEVCLFQAQQMLYAFATKNSSPIINPSCDVSHFEQILDNAHFDLENGNFMRPLSILSEKLQGTVYIRDKNQLIWLADCWKLLGNIQMEMGFSYAAIQSSERAIRYYKELKHPRGIAHSLAIKSNALGQILLPQLAVESAKNALTVLDNTSTQFRRGIYRAEYIGLCGQFLSQTRYHHLALKKLTLAEQICVDSGSSYWATTWSMRTAQHFLRSKDLKNAELAMERAEDHTSTSLFKITQQALRSRIKAEIALLSGQINDAIKWTKHAYLIGENHNMTNQTKKAKTLLDFLMKNGHIDQDDFV
ncbi:MAG: hypothetical protein HQM06_17675 [Magnetococcales bacterium]|nr:hypothetical protein [Magnetococcales bacterium]